LGAISLSVYVERSITERFIRSASSMQMVALVGPRQSGKTTFLKRMNPGTYEYLIFDDPDVLSLFNEDIKAFDQRYLGEKGMCLLDEVQYGEDAGRKLKYLIDMGRRLWVTSSSEALLSKDVFSYLVGRVAIQRLYPFSLEEYTRGVLPANPTKAERKRALDIFMTYGGYPRIALEKDNETRRELLYNLYDTMLMKDVAQLFSISDNRTLRDMVSFLASTPGSIMSYDRVGNALGISYRTVRKYLDGLAAGHIIHTLKPYYTNKAKEISKQPKVYFLDIGLMNSVNRNFSGGNDGRSFETLVFNELIKSFLELRYWRTKWGSEVDFVILTDIGPIPVESKKGMMDGPVPRGLRAFIDSYSPPHAFVVTYEDVSGTDRYANTDVTLCSIWNLASSIRSLGDLGP